MEKIKMKNWTVVALCLLVGLVGCSSDEVLDEKLNAESLFPLEETGIPLVYDDQQSTVFIKVDGRLPGNEETAIVDLIKKKRKWEQQFPTKKIITMSVVAGSVGIYGHSVVFGLLIHYEQR